MLHVDTHTLVSSVLAVPLHKLYLQELSRTNSGGDWSLVQAAIRCHSAVPWLLVSVLGVASRKLELKLEMISQKSSTVHYQLSRSAADTAPLFLSSGCCN